MRMGLVACWAAVASAAVGRAAAAAAAAAGGVAPPSLPPSSSFRSVFRSYCSFLERRRLQCSKDAELRGNTLTPSAYSSNPPRAAAAVQPTSAAVPPNCSKGFLRHLSGPRAGSAVSHTPPAAAAAAAAAAAVPGRASDLKPALSNTLPSQALRVSPHSVLSPSSAVRTMATAASGSSVTATSPATADKQQESLVLRPTKAPKEKRRLDYKPTDFLIDKVNLDFQLHPEETLSLFAAAADTLQVLVSRAAGLLWLQVTSTLTMRRREGTPPAVLRLDGEGLLLKALYVDGKKLEGGPAPSAQGGAGGAPQDGGASVHAHSDRFFLDEEGALYIPAAALPEAAGKPFEVKSQVAVNPRKNLKLSGLYVTNELLCTQCEAEGFRRITFFLDRPDVMALYTVRLEADEKQYPTLLSNGNRVKGGPVEGSPGRHYAVFEDPHKKPCYLFALVAGPLASVKDTFPTKSGKEVKVEVFSEGGETQKLEFALEAVKRSMAWDEKVFGLEYDLEVFNVVCVRDFNMGAMENKGLNIFNSSLLLADPKTTTDAEYERILGVVGHEYFHNWTGNRVTCRDWFQLTLKEGLTVFRDQLFSAAMGSHAVKRIEDVCYLRAHQFPEDSGPMSHPIRPESYIAMDNFYTLTVYEKGAEVIRMMHTMLGAEGFRKGMDLYFKRHDGQAVTCDDFRAAMADANGKDLTQFERWYSQSGTPEVEVLEQKYDPQAKTFTLRLRQQTKPTPGQPEKLPLVIPVRLGLIGKESKRDLFDPPSKVLEFTKEEETFVFEDIKEPCVVSLLRDFSAPVKLRPFQTDEETAFLMSHDSDAFNRWQAANTLAHKLLLQGARHLIQKRGDGEEAKMPPLSEIYKNAFKTALLDEACDQSIKALTLQLPSWEVLSQELSPIDPDALHKAILSARLELAEAFKGPLSEVYKQLTLPAGTEETLEAPDVARRRLRNVLLRLLSTPGDAEAAERAYQHFKNATCMTDRYAALLSLADMQQPQREKAFQEFFEEAAGDPLMLDKWFRAQAGSDLPDQVERVAALQRHDSFTMRNPNRMRALLSVFTFNRRHFHRADGAGYKLIGDAVIEVDAFNPQAAARLAGSFLQWRRFDSERQKLMQAQLERIRDAPGTSPDTLEIVQRALKPVEADNKTAS
ncbi:hypothetical protein Emed_007463 [Eimeria media]